MPHIREDVPALRAIVHPVNGAPWPRKSADGTAPVKKDPLRLTAATVQARIDRDVALKAGPALGAADSARHVQNNKVFTKQFLWPLENQAKFLRGVELNSKEYQDALSGRRQEEKQRLISATVASETQRFEAASRSQQPQPAAAAAGSSIPGLISPSAVAGQLAGLDDASMLEAMTQAKAFEFFGGDYENAVMGIWNSNKQSVSRAGGTASLMRAVWGRMDPKKKHQYIQRAAVWAREEYRRTRPQFQHAMQHSTPSPLPEGPSFSLETAQNWHTKHAAAQDPVGVRHSKPAGRGPAARRNDRTGGHNEKALALQEAQHRRSVAQANRQPHSARADGVAMLSGSEGKAVGAEENGLFCSVEEEEARRGAGAVFPSLSSPFSQGFPCRPRACFSRC